MTPTLCALIFRGSHSDPSGVGLIFGLIAVAAIIIIALAKSVLGGNRESQPDSLSLRGSDSTGHPEPDAPDPDRERFHEKAMREQSAVPQPRAKVSALVQESIHGWSGETHDAADQEFEAMIADTIPVEAQEKAFYVKVVGTSHRNSDRTSRTRIIGECSTFDSILLVPEPDNKFDPDAIAVRRRETNEQLGYLDSRLAGEITCDMNKYGARWVAFFRRQTRHPDTGKTAGAVIRLIRLSEEFIAQSEAVKRVTATSGA